MSTSFYKSQPLQPPSRTAKPIVASNTVSTLSSPNFLSHIGSIYYSPSSQSLIYSFTDPDSFPSLLQSMPMTEGSLRLLGGFVHSDGRLQKYLSLMRWEILRQSLTNMHFEDAVLLKMVVINFRLKSHLFDFEHFDEIFDVLNEIDVARQQNIVSAGKMQKEWGTVLESFLQTLAVGLIYTDGN